MNQIYTMANQYVGRPNRPLSEPNYGTILCSSLDGVILYALVKRATTYGLGAVLRGGWEDSNFAEISNNEKLKIHRICKLQGDYKQSFYELYRSLGKDKSQSEETYMKIFNKYFENFIENRELIKNKLLTIDVIYPYGIWGFPKGKRDRNETEIECAVRELFEETQIHTSDILFTNIQVPVENYYGWKYQYYVCVADTNIIENKIMCKGEISDVVWCSYEEAMHLIPQVMEEKRSILTNVHNTLTS